jgi:hypothetical protein
MLHHEQLPLLLEPFPLPPELSQLPLALLLLLPPLLPLWSLPR